MSGDDNVRKEKHYRFPGVDLDKPRYDQSTYIGRAKHFFIITNPLNLLASSSKLESAKQIVLKHRSKEAFSESITEDQLWRAKYLYDSAYHPDTGEKMIIIGRMSAQVPANIFLTTGIMLFYKTTRAVLFWQWINQSFNATVNYSNRSGDTKISKTQLFVSYVCATSGAVGTGVFVNGLVKNFPPLIGRFVPFVSVAVANSINIPCMRSVELMEGTPIFDENDNKVGMSTRAAQWGIVQVILSRVSMAIPSMCITPFIMDYYERIGTWAKYPNRVFPVQLGMIAFSLVLTTPLACAFFKQRAEFKTARLEASAKEQLVKKFGGKVPEFVYYNKGL